MDVFCAQYLYEISIHTKEKKYNEKLFESVRLKWNFWYGKWNGVSMRMPSMRLFNWCHFGEHQQKEAIPRNRLRCLCYSFCCCLYNRWINGVIPFRKYWNSLANFSLPSMRSCTAREHKNINKKRSNFESMLYPYFHGNFHLSTLCVWAFVKYTPWIFRSTKQSKSFNTYIVKLSIITFVVK